MSVVFYILIACTAASILFTLFCAFASIQIGRSFANAFLNDIYEYEQNSRVFLSFRREFEQEANLIREELERQSLSVFMYDPSAPFDDPITSISDAIRSSPLFLLVCSPSDRTDWVDAEIDYAVALQKRTLHVQTVKDLPPRIANLAARCKRQWWPWKTFVTREFDALERAFIRRASNRTRGLSKAYIDASVSIAWEEREAGEDFDVYTRDVLLQWAGIGIYYGLGLTAVSLLATIGFRLLMKVLL